MSFVAGAEGFTVTVERGVEESVLVLSGELDHGGTSPLRDAVVRALDGAPATIIFEVSDLSFIDSSGLGVLASTVRRLPPGGRIVVRGANANVRKVLDLTGLATILTVEDA